VETVECPDWGRVGGIGEINRRRRNMARVETGKERKWITTTTTKRQKSGGKRWWWAEDKIRFLFLLTIALKKWALYSSFSSFCLFICRYRLIEDAVTEDGGEEAEVEEPFEAELKDFGFGRGPIHRLMMKSSKRCFSSRSHSRRAIRSSSA
jgi:hypothetical protein